VDGSEVVDGAQGGLAVEALIFDVFGTCVDWRSGVSREVARAITTQERAIDALAFADAWRGRYQPAMEEIRSGRRGYVDLDIIHRENLDATLEEFGLGLAFDDAARAELNRAWEKLPPWPDVVPGLTELRKRFIVAACSNGSIALMTRLAKYGGIFWDCILGAGLARAYKPDPNTYLRSCEALRLMPAQVMMVAAHNDDLAAASKVGLKTAFVPRAKEFGDGGGAELRPTGDWDLVATDLEDLARQLNS
jgi:2-haloacid dehalogenase